MTLQLWQPSKCLFQVKYDPGSQVSCQEQNLELLCLEPVNLTITIGSRLQCICQVMDAHWSLLSMREVSTKQLPKCIHNLMYWYAR